MLEPQDGLISSSERSRRCDVPDALPHRLLELAVSRHRFAVGPARRCAARMHVVVDCALDPVFFDGQVRKIAAREFRALPCDRGQIGRWR